MPRSMTRELENLLEEAYNVLRRSGRRVDIIEYPLRRRKAFDLVCNGRRNIFARIVYDASNLSREDANELRASAHAYGASPIVIAKYVYGYEAEDDVVYERHGLYIISIEGLKQVARDEPLFILNSHGVYTVRINPKKLRRLREERGMSLGELADRLGVSRKTVYEYERGTMRLSVDKAVKLFDIFGGEVFEPINILEVPKEETYNLIEPDVRLEEMIINYLRKKGYRVVHLRRTPIDIIGYRRREDTVSVIVKHFISERRFLLKINEAEKIVSLTGSQRVIVEDEKDLDHIEREN